MRIVTTLVALLGAMANTGKTIPARKIYETLGEREIELSLAVKNIKAPFLNHKGFVLLQKD